MDINKLKAKRAGLVTEMRSLLDTAAKEGRDLSADEQTKYNQMEKDVDSIGSQVSRAENLTALENKLSEQRDSNYRPGLIDDEGKPSARGSKEYRNAFFGPKGFLRNRGVIGNLTADIVNVLQTGVDADGGYLVPEEYETEIQKLLYNADPIRAAATVLTLSSDRNLPIQTGGASFAWIGENGAYPATDPNVGRVVLRANKLGGYIPVSEELLADSGSNVEAFVRDTGVQEIADTENAAFAAGSGAGQPEGLFTVTTVAGYTITGTTGGVSASAAITADNLVDTFHGLGRQYRARATWLTSDTMVKLIRKLKTGVSGDNTYIWQPGLTAGQPDTILGRPVTVSDFAPEPAVSTKSIVFGDLSRYYIADRVGLVMRRLNELGALNGQVYFLMSKRTDGRLVDGRAITWFTHGAAS